MMGIPRFAYRMRDYGVTARIGAKDSETSQTQVAVIDGPSLAHFVFQNSRCDDNEIVGSCDYAALGNATIQWLDRLQLYEFKIEAIFFDGALPSHKRHIRVERLQRYVDKLLHFKQMHDEIKRATGDSGTNLSDSRNSRRLDMARKDLAPPPFLVLAIVEALFESPYAKWTYVVPGEADPFCAVAARNVALRNSKAAVTIFTNDSDLIVYESGPQTKVAMINSVEERQDGDSRFLEAFQFFPRELTALSAKPMSDLIRPAYEMLDLHVSFRDALTKSAIDVDTTEYKEFAESYSLSRSTVELENLTERRERNEDILQTDARISELVCQAVHESQRLEKVREGGAGQTNRTNFQSSDDASRSILRYTSKIEVQQNPCQHNDSLSGSSAFDLDMFLPMLLEDPSRASAWKVGVLFRNAAESLLLEKFGLDSTIFEHRKSGSGLGTNKCKKVSLDEALRPFTAGKEYKHAVSQPPLQFNGVDRWRFFIMQLVLADVLHDGTTLPGVQDIVNVLIGMAPRTWNQVHLLAQYQAEYYSLRMLKEVLRFLRDTSSRGTPEEDEMYEQLESLLGVSAFFNPGEEATAEEAIWQTMVKDFLDTLGPTAATMPQKKRKVRRRELSGVACEKAKGFNDKNAFAILCDE